MQKLLDDDFSAWPVGPFPSEYTAVGEYHYEPGKGRLNGWYEATNWYGWRRRLQSAWTVFEDNGRHRLLQVLDNDARDRSLGLSRMLVAGREEWGDLTLRVEFRILKHTGFAGVAVRYTSSRKHIQVGLDAPGRLGVWRQDHDKRSLLAAQDCPPAGADAWLKLEIALAGSRISVRLDNGPELVCAEPGAAAGRIALVATCPCIYARVVAETSRATFTTAINTRDARERELCELRGRLPQPQLWKTIATPGFGTGRQLRFGHLLGDDSLQMVLAQNARLWPGEDSYATVGALTALDLDGNMLWQFGEPSPALAAGVITCDLGCQIADIDGDGRAEVLCQKNFHMYILEGATGRVKNVFPLPADPNPENPFGRLNGDAVVVANFRGLPQPMDILVKNRYRQLWAYDNNFNLLWIRQGNTGHFPVPYDFDGSGRDALFAGYTLYSHDGEILWTHDLPDHTDEIVIGPFDPARTDRQIATASGDAGLLIFSQHGEILHRELPGHAQRLSAARYREDLEGVQFYLKTYWGNPDIISLHDCRGRKLFEFEPTSKGNLLSPVNWTGNGVEFALLNGDPVAGGMLDGHGRRVVMFPDDGHPTLCAEALDLNGDGLDEIVLWDRERLWIYAADRAPATTPTSRPRRWPHWNNSNYRGEISLPGRMSVP